MEIEIKQYMPITNSDFINTKNIEGVNYSGDLTFNEIPINNIENNSIILEFLKDILEENNLNKEEYDIYFQRNKEWYNKFIFYKKNN